MNHTVHKVSPDEVAAAAANQTLATTLHATASIRGGDPALRWRVGDSWQSMSWREYAEQIRGAASGLRALGVEHGDRVSFLVSNRPEFLVGDLGATVLGAAPTSIYSTSSSEQIEYQLAHAGSGVLIVEGESALERVRAVRDRVPTLRHVVGIDCSGDDVVPWAEVASARPIDSDEAASLAKPEDLATLIYTSGTTGPPKAAMLTHAGIMANIEGYRHLFGADHLGARVISYLPVAHIGERANSIYSAIAFGYEVTTCPSPQAILEYLPAVKPQIFFGPPRIWEKLWFDVVAALGEADDEERKQFEGALDVGRAVAELRHSGRPIPQQLLEEHAEAQVALRVLKERVRLEELDVAVTAAAALPPATLLSFHALGVPLTDLYGMSEFCGVTGSVRDPKPGTVGRPFAGVEIRIADDSEILARGPGAFVGYLNDPAKTDDALQDGWVATGDLGSIDDDGYLTLIGRKKDLIITSGGKNVSPGNLESALMASPLVGTVCAIGDGRPFITALVTLDPQVAPLWAQARGIEATTIEELATDETVLTEITSFVEQVNQRLARVEQIKKVHVLAEAWGPDSDVLTPTMKVKRHVVMDRYRTTIEDLYS